MDEAKRRENIEDNKRILSEIGLINPFKNHKLTFKKSGLKRKADSELQRKPKRPLLERNVDTQNHGSLIGTRRRSARIQGTGTPTKEEIDKEIEEWKEEDEGRHVPVEKNRPNLYGAVEGVEVGASWLTRMECCRDGIHRPTVAGIHAGPDGAYSIALSGGYDDNVDWGDCFTYTGEGGRDLKGTKSNPKNLRTAPQSKDQTLTRGNLALSRNVETGNPVRVIRGYKLTSPFAPEEGYRYDGLYTVEKAWFTTGLSGFGVWKFALRRVKDQAPPLWEFTENLMDDKNNNTAITPRKKQDVSKDTGDDVKPSLKEKTADDGDSEDKDQDTTGNSAENMEIAADSKEKLDTLVKGEKLNDDKDDNSTNTKEPESDEDIGNDTKPSMKEEKTNDDDVDGKTMDQDPAENQAVDIKLTAPVKEPEGKVEEQVEEEAQAEENE